MELGFIKEIIRYPVKSFRGESIHKTKVMDYGLYGDRSHALLDETRHGKFLTITQYSDMVRYKARFIGPETMTQYPEIEVTTPEGMVLHWSDQRLIKEVERKINRQITSVSFTPSHVPIGAIEEEHILLITDASIRKIGEMYGEELDYRRFRPNLYIDLIDKIPYIEETWIGKSMKIGSEVEIQLKRRCERCMIITVNPGDAKKDMSLLRTVALERDNYFGVYASVIKAGDIHAGDKVVLV
ncbi:MOSC domain-containing protein [Peribacillus saganii]|uniref:MOSC domain-containing protein n=1 Tax=Peribacillus saganii TaxID=2303992 RepID=A0A372LQH1_9BACI|nr:MOSC domain-containing protein [Peribacillus saganii]RFU70473.1 MOSC domain-containing protein [Peribacillus saganii]